MTIEGYLKKLSSNGLRWQQRYFKVVSSQVEYADSKNSKDWKTLIIGNPEDIYTTDRFGCFQIVTLSNETNIPRKIDLKAKNLLESSNWVTELRELSTGYSNEGIEPETETEGEENEENDINQQFLVNSESLSSEYQGEFTGKTIEEQKIIVHNHLNAIYEEDCHDYVKILDDTDHALDELEGFLEEIHDIPTTTSLVCEMFYTRILHELSFIDSFLLEDQPEISTECCIRPVAIFHRFNVLIRSIPYKEFRFQPVKDIEEARISLLFRIYLEKIDKLISSCCSNLIARYEQEFTDFDNFSLCSIHGYRQTTLSVDLSRMIQENIEVANSTGEDTFREKTIDLCIKKILEMQKTMNNLLRKNEWTEESVISMEFDVAKVNDYAECFVVIEEIEKQKINKGEEHQILFEELYKEFADASDVFSDRILARMFGDLQNILTKKLFKDQWEDGNAMATIVCTFKDYFDELKDSMHKAFFNKIIKKAAVRTIHVYVKAMISAYKEISRKAGKYKYSDNGIMQIEKDYQALVKVFGSYVPHKYFIEDIQILKDIYHFLKCSFDEVVMSFECVIRQNENCFLEVLDALRLCLKLRPHLNQGMRKAILSNCIALNSNYMNSKSSSSKSQYKQLFPEAGVKHCTGVPWNITVQSNSLPRIIRSLSSCEMPNSPASSFSPSIKSSITPTSRSSFRDAFSSPRFRMKSSWKKKKEKKSNEKREASSSPNKKSISLISNEILKRNSLISSVSQDIPKENSGKKLTVSIAARNVSPGNPFTSPGNPFA